MKGKKIGLSEAMETIKEYGIDCDNYVIAHYNQKIVGGDPTDNSIETAEYFFGCLKIVCNYGIDSFNDNLERWEWRLIRK